MGTYGNIIICYSSYYYQQNYSTYQVVESVLLLKNVSINAGIFLKILLFTQNQTYKAKFVTMSPKAHATNSYKVY